MPSVGSYDGQDILTELIKPVICPQSNLPAVVAFYFVVATTPKN